MMRALLQWALLLILLCVFALLALWIGPRGPVRYRQRAVLLNLRRIASAINEYRANTGSIPPLCLLLDNDHEFCLRRDDHNQFLVISKRSFSKTGIEGSIQRYYPACDQDLKIHELHSIDCAQE